VGKTCFFMIVNGFVPRFGIHVGPTVAAMFYNLCGCCVV
jgi:hypothetical protein